MGKIITFANQKGGTGKTTTVINTAGILATKGYKVLVVDTDPQGSLTTGFLGLESLKITKDLTNVLMEEMSVEEIRIQARPNIDVLPATINLSEIDILLLNHYDRAIRLKNTLDPYKSKYDYILIDSPPSLGVLFVNGLVAADGIVIPMACEFFSLIGVSLLLKSITQLKKKLNSDLEILGILPTRFDKRTNHSQDVLEALKAECKKLDVNLFDTVIKSSTAFMNANANMATISEYDKNHVGAKNYLDFTEEIITYYEQ